MSSTTTRRSTQRRGHRVRSRLRAWGAALTTLALLAAGGAQAASAATVYQIEGRWAASTPSVVSKGDTLVSEWRFNLNDDAPAPGNATIPNVTVTLAVANGAFTVLPTVCLTAAVQPASSISADRRTLTCNLGDRAEGTAELVLTGIKVTGNSGDSVAITGQIGGVSAVTPNVPIMNAFAMDMKWDGGSPSAAIAGTSQELSFPWSLRHAPGAEAGPAIVTYRVTITASNGETVIAQPVGVGGGPCAPISSRQPGHPYSTGGGAANTAPFVTSCTVTPVVGQPGQFDVRLSGITYAKTVLPTKDSANVDLDTGWDVVASGMLKFRFLWVAPGQATLAANAPTYTTVGGATSTDLVTNNANSAGYTRGSWNGGWSLGRMANPMPGSQWADTFRQMAGEPAMQIAQVRPPDATATSTAVCSVIDTLYVTFESATVGVMVGGVTTPPTGPQPTLRYDVGNGANNVLNPAHANYNPNVGECNTALTGWVTTPPADLSTVKAVEMVVPTGATPPAGDLMPLNVMTRIKTTAVIGQDIYAWTSVRLTNTGWVHQHRTGTTPPGGGTALAPPARYPYTGGGRDVLRVIGATPVIDKIAGQTESIPGATIGYTLNYRANAAANTVLAEYTLVDVLPPGTTYAAGSATTTPTSVTTLGNGRTELRWVFSDVSTNTDYSIHYDLVLPTTAAPGDVFVNNAAASIGAVSKTDTARVKIRDGGATFITKTALNDLVPVLNGVAEGGWTVRLSSDDTVRQAFTDTIDVLPFVGDGRGTTFTGGYTLKNAVDVTNMPGATVYYTTAPSASLSDDPKDASHGAPGTVAGNTVGWSTTFTASATAIRVIGGALAPSATQSFTVSIVTTDASYDDTYVNRAQARTDRTQLVMRTSDLFRVAGEDSIAIKKYVQDGSGAWHDANNIDDYPSFVQGTSVRYRLVVTNTGSNKLTNVAITDDKVDLAALSPVPTGLAAGALIPEILAGVDHAVTIEYVAPLAGTPVGASLVNTACAVPAVAGVDESCDPAGVTALPSSLGWTKVAADASATVLAGAEWSLTLLDDAGAPTSTVIAVTDCQAPSAAESRASRARS